VELKANNHCPAVDMIPRQFHLPSSEQSLSIFPFKPHPCSHNPNVFTTNLSNPSQVLINQSTEDCAFSTHPQNKYIYKSLWHHLSYSEQSVKYNAFHLYGESLLPSQSTNSMTDAQILLTMPIHSQLSFLSKTRRLFSPPPAAGHKLNDAINLQKDQQ